MRIETGIHTIELYVNRMRYAEIQRCVDHLVEEKSIQFRRKDSWNVDRYMTSNYLAHRGVRVRMYQTVEHANGMGLILNPSSVLAGHNLATELFVPTEQSLERFSDTVEDMLEQLQVPSEDLRLTLCQLDLTMNLWMPQDWPLETYLRLFYKGTQPNHFSNIAKKEDRKYIYMIIGETVAFKAYDKVWELHSRHCYPEDCDTHRLLRLEVSLKRDAILRKLKVSRKDGYERMLRKGGELCAAMITDYLRRVFPSSATHRAYKDSKKRIETMVADPKLREQMLYLLRKTSDGEGLTTAVKKLKKEYPKIDKRHIRKLWALFDEINVNPISIPNQKKIEALPCIRTILSEPAVEPLKI